MKLSTWIWKAELSLLASLAMTIGLVAQDNMVPHHHRHQTYRLIDMGTFGGPASELTTNNGIGVGAKILSDHGLLTGSADTPETDPDYPNCFGFTGDCYVTHTFRLGEGVRSDLGALPGVNSSQGTGVNELGWITGLSVTDQNDPITGGPALHAVLWKNRRIADLGTLGGYESWAMSVNDAGEIVGVSTVPGPIDPYSFLGQSVHGFIWRNGAMRDIGTLGGPDSFPGYAYESTGIKAVSNFRERPDIAFPSSLKKRFGNHDSPALTVGLWSFLHQETLQF